MTPKFLSWPTLGNLGVDQIGYQECTKMNSYLSGKLEKGLVTPLFSDVINNRACNVAIQELI